MTLPKGSTADPALRARRTWNMDQWGSGYFDVDDQGHALVRPLGSEAEGPALPLSRLTDELREAGLRLPVLVRFSDILHDRVEQLCDAFDLAMREEAYAGGYTAVYPIKVNQQRRVVEEILATRERGHGRVGLEAGSKPELLAVLALSTDGPSLIVCNGYKDREYVRLALMGEKLGHRVYLVVEKFSELPIILEEAESLGVTPRIGLRAPGHGRPRQVADHRRREVQVRPHLDPDPRRGGAPARGRGAGQPATGALPPRLADRQHP